MPYLKYHPASKVCAAGQSLRFSDEGCAPGSLRLGSRALPAAGSARGTIGEVESAVDLVDRRLQNLHALVARFGLDDDDGPKAA